MGTRALRCRGGLGLKLFAWPVMSAEEIDAGVKRFVTICELLREGRVIGGKVTFSNTDGRLPMTTHGAIFRIVTSCICIGLLTMVMSYARAFQVSAAGGLEHKIAQETEKIREGERSGMDALNLGRMWGHLGEDYEDAGQLDKAESAYNHALQLLGRSPEMAKDYAAALDNLGSLYLVEHNKSAAERCHMRALAVREATGDKVQIARGKSLLAEVYLMERKYKDAQQMAAEAYDAMVSLKDATDEIVATLVTLTLASSQNGQRAFAAERGRDAKTLALAVLPADCLLIGEARMALGYAEWKAGMKDGPDEEMQEGIRILKKWSTAGHPYGVGAMTLYATYLKATHRKVEARQVAEQARVEMSRLPGACADCTVSVYGLRTQ